MKKILIIRFSSIGDIVLTSPVIRCIKEQISDCEIHYLTKKKYHSIVKYNPNVSRVILLDDKLSDVLVTLKEENYTYIVDLHKNIRSNFVIRKLKVQHGSFNKLNFRKWVSVNFKLNILPEKHLVDRYFESLRELKVVNDYKGLNYYIGESDQIEVKKLGAQFLNGFIVWAIGGQYFTKIYPENHIIEICKKTDRPILLVGGKQDQLRGDAIEKAVGKSYVKSLCGQLSVNQSASLIKQSMMVISNDTGMMHIAAAYKKKIISLWGNTIPAFGMTPYFSDRNSIICEVKNLPCRPCSKIGYTSCPKKHFKCMNDIPKEMIIKEMG